MGCEAGQRNKIMILMILMMNYDYDSYDNITINYD